MDSESLWLQNSINLADPFDTSDRSSNSDKSANLSTKDLDLVAAKSNLTTEKVPVRNTTQFRSSVRMSSLCNPMLFPSSSEIDEMKTKMAQLQREKLKWEDTCRDLERAKTELAQTKEDYKVLEEYAKKIKTTADESNQRADRDAKARQEAESKLVETVLSSTRDVQQLKQKMDEAERQFSHDVFELKEEHNAHMAKFAEENAVIVSELKDANETLSSEMAAKEQEWQAYEEKVRVLDAQLKEASELRNKATAEMKSMQVALEDRLKKEREEFAQQQRDQQSKMELLKEQKDTEAAELRIEHGKQTKALTSKLEEMEKKCEKLRDDVFTSRSQAQDKADQLLRLQTEKELEIKKLCDSHRSAILEQKMVFDEELQVSRSQFRALTDELSESKKLITKLEGELGVVRNHVDEKDRELTTLRREVVNYEQRLESAVAEVNNLTSQLEQADDLLSRMASDRDNTNRALEEDLTEARDKTKRTEEEVLQLQKELSAQRREFMKADVEHRRANEELSAKLSAMQQRTGTEQSEQVRVLLNEKKRAEEAAVQLTASVAELQRKLHASHEEHLQEINRREEVENRLSQHQQFQQKRSAAMRNVSVSPIPATVLGEVTNNRRVSEPPAKRARTEVSRTFAITGFKGGEAQSIRDAILTMPASTVEGVSNLPVPNSVTHMIARDALTIKLLTAAARGCWILPEKYVTDSCAAGYWLDEEQYGFQHKTLPFRNKTIAFSKQFKFEKQHYNTAVVLSEAGGARIVDEGDMCDLLVQSAEESNEGPTLTWDAMVRLIYPRVTA